MPDEYDQDDDDYCIADDSTECDCSRCSGAQLAWEHTQGWFGTDAHCDDPECPCNQDDDREFELGGEA